MPETLNNSEQTSIMKNIEVDFEKRTITPIHPENAKFEGVKVIGANKEKP